MNRSFMKRTAAGLTSLGMLLVGASVVAAPASAVVASTGYSPASGAFAGNTFTPPATVNPEGCEGLLSHNGPAVKAIVGTSSFTPGSPVTYSYLDPAGPGNKPYAIRDCEVLYTTNPGTSPDPHAGTPLATAEMTGFFNTMTTMFYEFTIPSGTPAGSYICNFAKDTGGTHLGGGNRKVTPVCFQVKAAPGPALAITKTSDAPSVTIGSPIGFTITVSSVGAVPATNVVLTDDLPATGGTWTLASPVAGCGIAGVAPAVLTCTVGTLTTNFHVRVLSTPTTTGTYANTATATALGTSAVQAVANETVLPLGTAALTLTKTADTASVDAGDPVGFVVTVGNASSVDAANVVLTDPLPAGTWTIDPAGTTAPNCSIPAGSPSTLTCNVGTLGVSASLDVHITSTTNASSPSSLPNVATATSTNAATQTATATITVNRPGLQITKTPDQSPISVGGSAGFSISVSNAGPGTAKSVVVTDPLPPGLTWSLDAGYAGPCAIAAGTLTCSVGNLAPNASVFSVHAQSGPTTAPGSLLNTASVSASNAPKLSSSATVAVVPVVPVVSGGCVVNCPLVVPPTATPPTTTPPTTIHQNPSVLPDVTPTTTPPTTAPPTTTPPTVVGPTLAPVVRQVLPVTALSPSAIPTRVLGENGQRLAFTGANVRLLLEAGLMLIVMGMGFLYAAKRPGVHSR